jgi:hypothetical protein
MAGEIKFALYLNKLTPRPDDYAARVVEAKTYTLEDVINIITREGKTQTEEEVRSVYLGLEKALVEIISNGGHVQLSIVNMGFTISGVFDSEDENFTEGKHRLNLKAYAGDILVEAGLQNRKKRVKSNEYSPEPTKLEDISSKTFNDKLTPGNMACLKGQKLQIDSEKADEGLYFVNDKGQATKVEHIARNMPAEVVFLIPAKLVKGTYWLEVRNRSGKALSTGRFKHALTVA